LVADVLLLDRNENTTIYQAKRQQIQKSKCNMIEKAELIIDLLDFSFNWGLLTHV